MASPDGNNALSSSDTSAFVGFKEAHSTFAVSNDGASAVWVRVFTDREVLELSTTIATTTKGALKIPAGRTVVWNFNKTTEEGHGYRGFSHICDTSASTTLRWFAK